MFLAQGTRPFSGNKYVRVSTSYKHALYACFSCFCINHKNYNFLACDWFKNVLFSTNSLAKLLSDSLLLDSLLSDSLISQSHSKL